MGRPRKTAPKHMEPEDESQEMPEQEETPAGPERPTSTVPMTKADVCRAALADGIETTEEALDFARTRFGIEIKPTDFTLYKSKAKQGATAMPKGKPGRKAKAPLVEGYVAPPEKPPSADEPDLLLALEGVKELVSQFGADRVKRMVDLLT